MAKRISNQRTAESDENLVTGGRAGCCIINSAELRRNVVDRAR